MTLVARVVMASTLLTRILTIIIQLSYYCGNGSDK